MKFWKKIFLYSVILFLILFNGAGIILIEKIYSDNLETALKQAMDKYLNVESVIYLNTDFYNDSNIKNWIDIVINGYSANNIEKFTNFWAIPPLFIITPEKIKNGIATREKLFKLETIF